MTDLPDSATPGDSPHAWVHEHLAAYLADGLSPEERQRFDAHVNTCAECFDAFTEARDADRALQRALAPLVPDADLEQRVVTHFRENTMKRLVHPLLRRAGYAAAACIALAATGVFANHIMHADGQFNNPFTERLVARADTAAPGLNGRIADLEERVANLRGMSSDLKAAEHVEAIRQNGAGSARGLLYTLDTSKMPGIDLTETMQFAYTEVPASTVVRDMANRFGFVVSGQLPQQRVTVQNSNQYDARGALGVINNILAPLGYTALASGTASDGDKTSPPQTVLRVMTMAEGKRAGVPVIKGADPNSIALNDDIRTQIIPLDHINAGQLTSELRPMISADADISSSAGSNAIVVTDTSANIHRLAEIVHSLDTGKASDNIIQYRQFASGNAGDAARVINQEFPPASAVGVPAGRAGGGGRGGGGLGGGGDNSVHAEVDAKTNTLVLSGKADEVEKAMEKVNEIDRAGAVAAQQKEYASIMGSGGPLGSVTVAAGGEMQGEFQGRDAVRKQGVGNGAFAYSVSPSASATDGSGFEFGSDNLRRGVDVNGNSIASGPTAGTNYGNASWNADPARPKAAAAKEELNTYGWVEGGYTFDGRQDVDAPRKTLEGGSGGNNWAYSANGADSFAVTGNHSLQDSITKTGSGTLTLGNTVVNSGGLILSGGAMRDVAGTVDLAERKALDDKATAVDGAARQQLAQKKDQSQTVYDSLRDARTAEEPPDKQLARATKAGESKDALDVRTIAGTSSVIGNGYVPLNGNASATTLGNGKQLAAATPPNIPLRNGTPSQTSQPPAAVPAAQPPKNPAPEIAAGLKIIKNGTVEFEVRSFDDTYTLIKSRAEEAGGFVASTNSDKLANGKVRGTIVVRVPPQSLDQFLSRIRGLGDLKAQQISATDVTKDYYDIDSELRGLTTMEARLLDLIKNGKGEVKDLIEAEKQLGETRIKIEKLKGQISYYDNLVALCTISITAYEKDITTPTAAYEQEIVGVNVETEQVESKYQTARRIFEDAKGHIVESQLKNTDAEHVAAHIVADVPPDQADFVAGQLKQLGTVASFNRDRKQTATGGSGTPDPSIQVEHKDTRFTLDLFNLANMQPRETTVLRVAVPDVEKSYEDVLARVRKDAAAAAAPAPPPAPGPAGAPAAPAVEAPRAVGRVVSSALNGQQPDQMSADIRAEVRAESADDILNAIRTSGEVLGSNLVNNPDNTNTTSAKEGIQLTLVNIASVPPKEVNSVTIAVRNVEEAYNTLLGSIRKAAPAGQNASPLMPPSVGRVLNSNLTGQQPEQMAGDIRAEIRTDMADDILRLAKSEGELLNSSTSEAPENAIATAVKRGLQVHFVNVAGVAPREAQQIRAVALDVPAAYQKLLSALQTLTAKDGANATGPGGSVHIFNSSLTGTDRRRMTASFTFDAPRSADADITRAFSDAGIDFLSRTIVRSSDTANTLDSKVRYQVDEIRSAETLDPRRTFLLTEEVPDVDKAVTDLKSMFPGLDFNISHPPGGDANAHAVADVSVEESRALRMAIANLHAVEKDNQVLNNNNVPESKFGRERVDISLRNEPTIIKKDQGVSTAFRAAMSTISAALFEAVYLIVVGLVFALPFLLILWLAMRIIRRRRRVPVSA